MGELFVAASNRGVVTSSFEEDAPFFERLAREGYEVMGPEDGRRDRAEEIAVQAVEEIGEYFSGGRTRFEVPLDFGRQTDFTLAVLGEVASGVPFGTTVSYGEIGERAGRPRAARAVGNIMANCPFSLLVPCHRVVHAQGPLRPWPGEPGEQASRKIRLLEHERRLSEDRGSDHKTRIGPRSKDREGS